MRLLEHLLWTAERRWLLSEPHSTTYWHRRCWDREKAMSHPRLGAYYIAETEEVVRWIKRSRCSGAAIEIGCGTGKFTHSILQLTDARLVTALDVSDEALTRTRQRCNDERLRIVREDFWHFSPAELYDLLVCVDVLHHLGQVPRVLQRVSTLVSEDGLVVGNLWTRDNYLEFMEEKYGRLLAQFDVLRFAVLSGCAWSRSAFPHRFRSHLLATAEIKPLLEGQFWDVLELEHGRYFSHFLCRGPKYA